MRHGAEVERSTSDWNISGPVPVLLADDFLAPGG